MIRTHTLWKEIMFLLLIVSSAMGTREEFDMAFDYIIVGSGSGGSVTAYLLSQRYNVLVLEAGPSDAERGISVSTPASSVWGTDMDWSYKTVEKSGLQDVKGNPRVDTWPKGKVWGGSSSINAMLYVRGQVSDYDSWAALTGDPSWLYANLLPYFLAIEATTILSLQNSSFHGKSGPLWVSEAVDPYSILGVAAKTYASQFQLAWDADYNGNHQESAGKSQLTQLHGWRWSTADAFLKPALARFPRRLNVRSGCRATRVVFAAGTVVTAHQVEYSCDNGSTFYTANATREIILCAGAVESPKLLLLSGVGDSVALAKLGIDAVLNIPAVGIGLMDHLIFPVTVQVNATTSASDPRPSDSVSHSVFHRSDPALADADIQVSLQADQWDGSLTNVTGEVLTFGVCLNQPKSTGNITLSSSDPFAPPLISPNYLSFDSELDAMQKALAMAQQVISAPPFSQFVMGTPNFGPAFPWGNASSVQERIMYVQRKSHTSYHPCCSLRMGSVVDSSARVIGTKNLRVIDASIMPRITSGNLNAPTTMLAWKIATEIVMMSE